MSAIFVVALVHGDYSLSDIHRSIGNLSNQNDLESAAGSIGASLRYTDYDEADFMRQFVDSPESKKAFLTSYFRDEISSVLTERGEDEEDPAGQIVGMLAPYLKDGTLHSDDILKTLFDKSASNPFGAADAAIRLDPDIGSRKELHVVSIRMAATDSARALAYFTQEKGGKVGEIYGPTVLRSWLKINSSDAVDWFESNRKLARQSLSGRFSGNQRCCFIDR